MEVRTVCRWNSFRSSVLQSVTEEDATVAATIAPWCSLVTTTSRIYWQVRWFSCSLVDDRRSATVIRRHLDDPPTNQRHDQTALIVTNGERYARRHLPPTTRTRLSHVLRKKTYAVHTRFPDRRRRVAVALSSIYNSHPRAVDGRFIGGARPRVRVTFWIRVVRKWRRLLEGLRTHRFLVLYRSYSLSPSSLLVVYSSLSLFDLRSPSTSLATVRRASHAGRHRCPFDLPRSSRVRKSASVAWLSRSCFSRSTISRR